MLNSPLLLVLQVPDGATVALIPRSQSSGGVGINQVFQTGESKNITNLNSLDPLEQIPVSGIYLEPRANIKRMI